MLELDGGSKRPKSLSCKPKLRSIKRFVRVQPHIFKISRDLAHLKLNDSSVMLNRKGQQAYSQGALKIFMAAWLRVVETNKLTKM